MRTEMNALADLQSTHTYLIDMDDALDRMCNDKSLLKSILGLYCEEKLMEADYVRTLIEKQDVKEIRSWCHQSLGISANLSLKGVIDDCSSISHLCTKGNFALAKSVFDAMLLKISMLREVSKEM